MTDKLMPMISIVTVCMNSADTIRGTIESVNIQTYQHLEHILVDGGSTDGTMDILRTEELRSRSEGKIFRWTSEPDRGIYDAMNKGIAMAGGEIIGILNSDDFYESNTLQLVADAAAMHPEAGLFYGFLRVLTQKGKELQVYRYRYETYLLNPTLGVCSGTQHPACFVRRRVYEQVGLFDVQIPIAADYDFLVRAMKAGVQFHALDSVLANFRLGGASGMTDEYERLRQRYAVLTKNGLLTGKESGKMQRQMRYRRYRAFKAGIVKSLFGP
jgi:glycosyltransferase involved in cell wall biosynthesis